MDLDGDYLFEPPLEVEAGDQLGWAPDCRTVYVYRDEVLREARELRDGAMRPRALDGEAS